MKGYFLSLFGHRALTNDLQAREKLAIWKTVMEDLLNKAKTFFVIPLQAKQDT